ECLRQRVRCLRSTTPTTKNLFRLGDAEHLSLLQPADEIGEILKEIHASPLLDEFGVHEIEAAMVSDHKKLSVGSQGRRHSGSHNRLTLKNMLNRLYDPAQ